MTNIPIQEHLQSVPSDQLIDSYLELYKQHFGERKFYEAQHIVYNGKKIDGYIRHLEQRTQWPTLKEVTAILNGVSFFLFSKSATITSGVLMIYSFWKQVMIREGLEVPEDVFKSLVLEALFAGEKNTTHFTNAPDIFGDFFQYAYKNLPLAIVEESDPKHIDDDWDDDYEDDDDL